MNNYQVDRARWQKLSIFDQMANIYSEVGRTFKAMTARDDDSAKYAVARALDLFDATSEGLAKVHSPKLREVLRAREIFATSYLDGKVDAGLENYFMQFAVAARRRAGA